MSDSIAILGRQPALGTAELERLYGAEALRIVRPGVAILRRDPADVNFDRLGGTVKLAKLLTRLDFTDWHALTDYLVEHIPKHTCCIGPGKLIFGLSTYGLKVNKKDIERTALSVKKAVTATNRPVRVVPTKGTELSSAQVLHNHMTKPPLGMELMIIRDGNGLLLAQTTHIQNIDAYAARDQARPKRDARVGMLPPKLAQTIVNLATADTNPLHGAVVLDPFCGTGVVLQEAALMGFDIYGTDLDSRMVEYTDQNLLWLLDQPNCPVIRPPESANDPDWRYFKLETGDATTHQWRPLPNFIACETYLGRPFSSLPNPATRRQVMSDVNVIHKKFLKNVAAQFRPGATLCLAVPAWRQEQGFLHLPILDQLEELGYTRISFVHVRNEDLVYHREGQIVARELVVLKRK